MKKKQSLHWSRVPGKFVNKHTGIPVPEGYLPKWEGTVGEWYMTLVETIKDCYGLELAQAPKIQVSPDVHVILMANILYKPSFKRGTSPTICGIKIHERKLSSKPKNLIDVFNNGLRVGKVTVMDMNII